MTRRERLALFAVVLIGLLFRILFLIQFSATPFYRHPTLDARYYHNLASNVSKGRLIQERAFFMGPLYPYSVGLLYRLFGEAPIVPRLFQMALGLGCCLLLYFLGRRLFSSTAGLIAAGLYAVYKPALFYEQTLLSETPMAFFCLVLIFYLIRMDAQKKAPWFAAGLLIGIAALFRGNILLFAPFLCVWLLMASQKDKWAKAVFLGAGIAAGVAPAALHNYLAERDFILITSNGGFNFFIGNNEQADGRFVMPPRVNMEQDPSGLRIAEADLNRASLKSSEVSRYWKNRAMAFIKAHPARFMKLLFMKIYYFWGHAEIAQIYSLQQMKGIMPILNFPLAGFWLIGPLSLLSLGMLAWNREKFWGVFLLFAMSYMLSLIPFFMTARYRIPIIPVLCLLAAGSVESLMRWFRQRRWKEAGSFAVGFAALWLLLNNTGVLLEKEEGAQFHNALGLIYKSEGKINDALAQYEKSLQSKKTPYALANLGNLYYDEKKLAEAANQYSEALKMEPDNARILFNRGQCYLALGLLREAQKDFEQALVLDERVQPLAHFNLALIYIKEGKKELAKSSLKRYLDLSPGDKTAKALLTRLASGD
ncbi:MAG: photosystem I assembly protein Ycf3 [candidate division BRC1 bacterium ADurb.Bin183]|nr:MAG: photosystem I assembly protein Ycf3 [candidate division BRC1 bacterium ADurb.Bin183]